MWDKRNCEKGGCTLIFLPTCSPDLNSIEKYWANLENIIKKIVEKFKSSAEAVDFAFRSFDF